MDSNNNEGSRTQKELLKILNSQKPDQNNSQSVSLINTNITDEDLEFLKAANEVIKIHENKVDPTIRDILNRLQYSNSPHGGMPISMQYLKSIGEAKNDNNDLRDRMSLLSTNDRYDTNSNHSNNSTRNHSIVSNMTDYSQEHLQFNSNNNNNNNNETITTTTMNNNNNPSYIVPPFTENPLRNPPRNLDFPQFSLDIFKSNDDIQLNNDNNTLQQQQQQQLQNLIAQNLTTNLRRIQNNGDPHTKISNLLNYSTMYHSNGNNDNNDSSNNDNSNNLHDSLLHNNYELGGRNNEGHIKEENEEENENEDQHDHEDEGEYEDEEDNYEGNEENRNDNNTQGYMGGHWNSIHNNTNNTNTNTNNNDNDNNNITSSKKKDRTLKNNDVPRNFKCSNCGISFKRSSDLKRHEKIHLKIPPNICPLCHKGFARKDALKRHVDTLTCKRNRQRLLKQLEEEKNGNILNHT